MDYELQSLIREEEDKFARRAMDRLHEADAIFIYDVRAAISRDAQNRDRARFWRSCKVVLWGGVFLGCVWLLFWWFR